MGGMELTRNQPTGRYGLVLVTAFMTIGAGFLMCRLPTKRGVPIGLRFGRWSPEVTMSVRRRQTALPLFIGQATGTNGRSQIY